MELKRFIHKIKQGVQEYLGEDVIVEAKQVTKNNGVVFDGLIIAEKKCNISPTIYLNDYFEEYEAGKPLSTIVYEILQLYEAQKPGKSMDMEFFLNYEKVRNKIVYKLIHYEKNKTLLKEIPHIPFLDMAVVFYCIVANEVFENATILIYNSHCHMWNVSVQDIYETAKRNTPKLLPGTVQSMGELMKDMDMTGAESLANRFPVYVLSNSMKIFGAASILYDSVLEMFTAQFDEDAYIIPSSVHEVILIPDSGDFDSRRLEEMVYEVNHTQLEAQEILSDRLYKYERKSGSIVFATNGQR